jgi:hypothetical protein
MSEYMELDTTHGKWKNVDDSKNNLKTKVLISGSFSPGVKLLEHEHY